ncbi:hypothetical protein [Thermoactinospora rubra]|uniref:hypothetical protein n=1 Tax=Thermoactinospora rubra TaxID=1088767 RepID=UPI00146FB714|nr:hypothetical protein [Thermoactinospora rubra]
MNEISRSEEFSLSGAALRGAPWKTAAIAGGATAAAAWAIGLVPFLPGFGLTGALGVGISLFALIAAIGAVSKPEAGDRTTRQARLWALQHPWKFSLLPAGITAVLEYPVQLIVDQEGIFHSAWDSMWRGALVYLIAGILTMSMRGRAHSR